MKEYKTILHQEKRLNKQFSCRIEWLCTLDECVCKFQSKTVVPFSANGEVYELDLSDNTVRQPKNNTELIIEDLYKLTVELKCRNATFLKLWYNGEFESDCFDGKKRLSELVDIKSLSCRLKDEEILQEATDKYIIFCLDC